MVNKSKKGNKNSQKKNGGKKTGTMQQSQQGNHAPKDRAAAAAKHCVLHGALSDYCKMVCDPFNAPPVGSPAVPAYDSLKYKVTARGMCYTNSTAGYGFVSVNLKNMVSSDYGGVIYSDSGLDWDGGLFGTGGATTGVGFNSGTSAFSGGTFGAVSEGLRKYRPVAAGLKITYAGTELNKGGSLWTYRDPLAYGTDANNNTSSEIENDERTHYSKLGNTHKINWVPNSVLGGQYNPSAYQSAVGTSKVASFDLMLSFQSAVVSQPFYYEVVAIYEIIATSQPGMTKSFARPNASETLQAAMTSAVGTTSTYLTKENLMKGLATVESVVNMGTEIVGTLGTVAGFFGI